MRKPLRIAVAVAIANIGMLHATGVWAGGTSFTEQGASGLGNSYAGMSSSAEDASVYYWNPAALTRFKRAELVGGLLVAQLATPFTNSSTPPCEQAGFTQNDKASQQQASRTPCNDPEDVSGVPGKTYERAKPARVAIPFNFAAIPLNDRLVMGLGASGSSGLVVRYPSDSPGRTQAESTDVKVIRLSGGLGYKLTPTFSIGGSFGYERMFLSLRARLNFQAAVNRAGQSTGGSGNPFSPLLGDALTAVSVPDDQAETSLRITMYGWAVNGQIGALWEPSERTRVGFGYRPKTTFENQGQLVIDRIPAVLATPVGGAAAGSQAVLLKGFQEARQRITLPSELNVSVFHAFTPRVDLMASYLRNDFSDSRLDFRTADGTVIQNPRQEFQVTNRYAVGANYKYAKRLTLRAGFAKENSAVKDENRLQSLPDNDRTFFNLGARWVLDRGMLLDVGYQKIRFKDAPVGLNPQITDVVFNGVIKTEVDIIGVQLVDQF